MVLTLFSDTQGVNITMRIKAYIGGKTPVYEMANGASESIGYIAPDSYITITGIKRDGANSYYMTEEYKGYIKQSAVKILRDEDFYYSSSLIRDRKNRSKTSRFNVMKKSVAADISATSIRSSTTYTGLSSGWNYSTGCGSIMATSVSDGWNNRNSGLVPGYSTTTVNVAANNSTGPKPATKTQFVASMAGAVIGGMLGGTKTGSFGSSLLAGIAGSSSMNSMNSYAAMNRNTTGYGTLTSGGGYGGAIGSNIGGSIIPGGSGSMIGGIGGLGSSSSSGGLNLGNIAGGIIGGLLGGANLGNIIANLAVSVIGGLLGTLLQKLNYVVGFNMSGMLLNVINGFASYNKDGSNGLSRLYGSAGSSIKSQNNAQLDQHIRKYFKYEGTIYTMTAYGGVLGGVTGVPKDYTTPLLSPKNTTGSISSGTQVQHADYATLYDDFEEGIKKVRTSMSVNLTRMDWFYNFNRFRFITPASVLANTKGYVFFTRPDLNLQSNTAITSEIGLLINSMATYHAGIVASLQKATSSSGATFDSGHQLIPILGNRCTGIDVNDETLETKEIGDTYTGWKLNYGMNNIKSKASNTVTTSFIDDEQLSIYLMFKLWTEYISNVSRGIIAPKDEYVRTLQLDYANSIYYFLCAEDGESIVFWTKYTGCIPTTSPSSNFSDQFDTAIRQPKYSITWQYSFKKDYDPYSIAEFNKVAGCQEGQKPGSMPIHDAETLRAGRTIVGSPWVDTQTGGLYKLHFREPQNKFEPEY